MTKDTELVKAFEFSTGQKAWQGINEYFLNMSEEIINRGGARYGAQLVSYDIFIHIRKSWVDPNFDFGNIFGYRRQKWTSLVNNYINVNFLDLFKAEVIEKEKKNMQSYNLSMQFDNSHGSGKNCLLSLTLSKRLGKDHPIMTLHLRSSEITKRLLWDLLLVQRIAEYIYGEKQYVSINLFCGNMYQNTESFIMYENHRSIEKSIIRHNKNEDRQEMDTWQKRALKTLGEFQNVDEKTIKYKVHLRSVRQLQKCENGKPISGDKPLLASDCVLFPHGKIVFPKDCVTTKDKAKFKKRFIKTKTRHDKANQK